MATQQYEPFSGKLDAAPQYEEFSGQLDKKPKKPAGIFRKAADAGLAFGQGAAGGTKALTDALGAGNAASRPLDKAIKGMGALMSDDAQQEIAARQKKIKDAEASGSVINEIGANLGGLAEAPVRTIAQGAGSIVPTTVAALLTRGKSLAPLLGIGAAQGAGAVKGSIYDAVEQKQIEAGMSPADAQAAASKAQEYTGPNAGNIAVGSALGAMAGRVGAEGAILGGGARGAFRTGVKAAGEESLTEGAQGGQERYSSNVAEQRQGFDTPTFEGVAGQAVSEGVIGGIVGGGAGAVSGAMQPPAQELPVGGPDGAGVNPDQVSAGPPLAPVQDQPAGLPPIDAGAITRAGQAAPGMGFDPNAITLDTLPTSGELPVIHPSAGPLSAAASLLAGPDGVIQAPLPVLDEKALGAEAAKKGGKGQAAQAQSGEATAGTQTPQRQSPTGQPAGPDIAPQGTNTVLSGAGSVQPLPESQPPFSSSTPSTPEFAPPDSSRPRNAEQDSGLAAPGPGSLASSVAHEGRPSTPQAQPNQDLATQQASQPPAKAPIVPRETSTTKEKVSAPQSPEAVQGSAQRRQEPATQGAAPVDAGGAAGQPAKAPAVEDVAQGAAPGGAPVIDTAAHAAATSPRNDLPEPTDAQKKAGNYPKGHVKLAGMDLSIENPAESARSGKDRDGKAWTNTLKHHYGYIKGTIGNDKDHVDAFVKPDTPLDYAGTVFIIDQVHPDTGKFDEHKVMIGFDNPVQARAAYQSNYAKGWKGLKAISALPMAEFKAWVYDGPKNRPLASARVESSPLDEKNRKAEQEVQPSPAAPTPKATQSEQSPPVQGSSVEKSSPDDTATPAKGNGLRVGTMPTNAEPVTVKDGVLFIGKYEALNFDTGEPVKIADGANPLQIRKALAENKVLSVRQKVFGGITQTPAETATKAAEPAERSAISPDVKTAPDKPLNPLQQKVKQARQKKAADAGDKRPSTKEVFDAVVGVTPYGKPYNNSEGTRQKARILKGLEGLGLKPREAQSVLDKAMTTEAQRRLTTMRFILAGDVRDAADALGYIRPADAPAKRDEYPLGKTDREDRFFGTRVRVLPELKGDEAWLGTIQMTLNGGRLFSVKRDGSDAGSIRIGGDRLEILSREDAEAKPKEPTKAPASINMLPLPERWDALVAHTKQDGGDPDKGQRSYRALTQFIGRTEEKPAEIWDRWSSIIGSTQLVDLTGPQVLRWMENNLPTDLGSYIRAMPGKTLSIGTGDARYWQNAQAEFERRTLDHNRYINRLEQQASDVEGLGGDADKVAESRQAIYGAKRAFNRNERDVQTGLAMAERKEQEQADQRAADEAAKYKPFDAKDLSKKPTPASMSGWFTAAYEGKTVWTQGTILDLSGEPPHLAGYTDRMSPDRNKDGKIDVSRVIPRQKGPEAVPFGFYDGEFASSAKAGVVYLEADGKLVGVNAIFFRYFASKFKGATYYASPDGGVITVQQGGKTVGVIMPIKLGSDAQPAPTIAELRAKMAAKPAPAPAAEAPAAAPAPTDRRRKAAEYVRQAVTKRTNANSAMVWQIIGPDGEAVSGPPGKYPGNDGPLAGSATMGNLGWGTKREAEAALAELNRKADEILGAAGAAPAPAADDRVLTIENGGSTQTLTLPKPAWQATDDELVQAVKDSGAYLGKPGSKYDPYMTWREAHGEAIARAAREGKRFPDNVLYDKPHLIRSDLSDDQSDVASDAMVDEYRATNDYAKAVQVYRDFGEQPTTSTPASAAPVPEASNASSKERLTDAGEELIRNRRGKLKGLAWDDVSAMNDTLKVAQVIKSNVWPRPDYVKMVEDGTPGWKAAALKAVYDKLAAAPVTRAAPTDSDLRAYIETMNQVRETLMAELDRVEREGTGDRLWDSLRAGNVFGKVFPIPDDAKPMFGKPSPFDRKSEQGKENNRRALLIGGNGAVQALQFSYKVTSKVKDLLADGFPKKQEAWQKSYEVRQTETRDSDVPESERTGGPQQRFYVYEKGSRWRLAKGGQDGGYATQEQAEAFARTLTARKREILPPSRGLDLADVKRIGPDWRGGKNVTSDQVMAHFGFRGVNLGEYVKAKQDIAQLHLNHVFDAFSDLADLLGVPPKAMSLNGTLGVAVGAQGSGKALAHFVPGVNEINITRDSGAGALAHEFGHAVDHYFATQHGRAASMAKRPYLSAVVENVNDAGGVRPEVMSAMRTVVKAINSRPMTEAEAKKYMADQRALNERRMDRWVTEFKGNRGADPEALAAVAEKLKRGDVGEIRDDDVESNLAEFMRAAGLKPGNMLAANAFTTAYRLRDLADEARFLASHIPQMETNYSKASAALDAKKTGDGYWGTPWEKFARAFETFVMDALVDRQRESLYLSGLVDSKGWQTWSDATGKSVPYPAGDERLVMQQAFQQLVDTIQTKEDDAGNVAMFNTKDDATFYSALAREISAIPAKSQGNVGWAMNIAGLVKAGKVKQDEVNWTGVLDWLRLQEGKVSKEQIGAYLDANGVQVQETVLGEKMSQAVSKAHGALYEYAKAEDRAGRESRLTDAVLSGESLDAIEEASHSDTPDAAQLATAYVRAVRDTDLPTKYDQYQLPGGTNYREVLLTLPGKVAEPTGEVVEDGKDAAYPFAIMVNGKEENRVKTRDVADAVLQEEMDRARRISAKKEGFRSSHWTQPNVLAHIRVNDRTDADGKKVLFVEEIQSDWGQEGKKKGFSQGAKGWTAEKTQYGWTTRDPNGRVVDTEMMADSAEHAISRSIGMGGGSVPAAPFVTKTDAWLSLALKRIVKMAADGGYDRVAFVNGEQSAERFSLDKQVDSIQYRKVGTDAYEMSIIAKGGGAVDTIPKPANGKTYTAAEVEEIIGKEMVSKMDSEEGQSVASGPWRKLQGDDLKIEAKGMRAFYDKIVPNTLKDVLKKLGGGALETVEIPGQAKPKSLSDFGSYAEFKAATPQAPRLQQPGFAVTPAMREKASGGLPMFAQAAYTPANGQQQSTADFSPQAAPRIEHLDRAIANYLGDAGTTARPFQARRLRDHAALQGLADAFGATVQGFRVDPSLLGKDREAYGFFNGVYTGGTVYLNEDVQRPHLAVLGHELAHHLAKTEPIRYQQLVRAIRPYVDPAKYRAFARTAVGRNHANNEDKLREEFVGEILSDGFMNRDFWRAVGKSNPNLLQRIVRVVADLLNSALAKMGYTNRTEQYLTDFNRVMQVAGEVMGEYGLKPPTVDFGELSFNRDDDNVVPFQLSKTGGDPGKDVQRYERLAQQVRDEYSAPGSPLTFEQYKENIDPIHEKLFEAQRRLRKWQEGRAAESLEDVFHGYKEIPIGTKVMAVHGLKFKEPTRATVVGRRGARVGDKAWVLPVVDFGDGDGRALLPSDIKEVFGGPSDLSFNTKDDAVQTLSDATRRAGNTLADYRGMALGTLGRRQITELFGKLVPQLVTYNNLMQQMDADKNEAGAAADAIAQNWAKLKDDRPLAELMHDATLAQMDPDKPFTNGEDRDAYDRLKNSFDALSPEAKQVYREARDSYRAHHEAVRLAIRARIDRSEIKGQRKADLLNQMDAEFYRAIKGVYFPLARFGDYTVIVRDDMGKAISVSRAETLNEAETLRANLRKTYPNDHVGKVLKSKEFNAGRDMVGRGFMENLYSALGKREMDENQRAELEDMLGQLYLSALPDLSWAKHGIHRKGTPGFSQDARRAFAQNSFHGARYLAKVRYSDLLENELTDAQKQSDALAESDTYDSVKAQQVIDEMVKRHDAAMNPNGNSLSTALTSLGFVFHLGLSPASALVNLSQTALVAFPQMGAKWGFTKASGALLKASQQAAANKNDISSALTADEKAAYDEAVRSGVIDVTMAHDLAGISQGEDAKVTWKLRPVMRWASFLFHHAERFNRQVTFVASYRLAREAGAIPKMAYEQAVKATYDGHFDYSNTNRPRFMQGNAAKVLLLFKQYGQNMVYTLSRQAYLSINGLSPAERAQARRTLGGLLAMHAAGAGALGLPLVTTLLAAASMIGGSDDEPWDAEVALRNMLADSLGEQAADVLARGLSRLTPWDVSGRVGLDRLILPDVQEGLQGQRLGESAMAAALGPVAGIGISLLRGLQEIADGNWSRGLEAMAPSVLRGPAKAVRYANEGAIDRTGKPIVEDVSLAGIAGQALGFSPSDVRLATEAKSAVHQADQRLSKRRAALMRHYSMAVIAGDQDGANDAREDIKAFNEKNQQRRINPLQMAQSVRMRSKQIAESHGGVYLPKTRRDVLEAGRFGMAN